MNTSVERRKQDLSHRRQAPLLTPTDLGAAATRDIAASLNAVLADAFALYLKTKNFHWHMSGPHFRDYHLMLDEQAGQILALTDPLAERIRKVGGSALSPSATLPVLNASSTTMPSMSSRWTCSPNCARTTRSLRRDCARPTTSATSIATSPARVS
jgi:hypothetical protein